MTLSNTERQRRYRERQKAQEKKSITVLISRKSYDNLCRIGDHTGKPFNEIIDGLLSATCNDKPVKKAARKPRQIKATKKPVTRNADILTRDQAVALAREMAAGGMSRRETVAALGLKGYQVTPSTVQRWLKK